MRLTLNRPPLKGEARSTTLSGKNLILELLFLKIPTNTTTAGVQEPKESNWKTRYGSPPLKKQSQKDTLLPETARNKNLTHNQDHANILAQFSVR